MLFFNIVLSADVMATIRTIKWFHCLFYSVFVFLLMVDGPV